MLHIEDPAVRALLLQGNFGLEKEGMRVTADGRIARTPHPFPGNPNIVRDFSEAQTEINTGVHPTPAEAVAELAEHTATIQRTLAAQKPREYLWPSSNPPLLANEADVPIAQFEGDLAYKTAYREHLSRTYGRYKMTFSGIHFNFSFGDDLLQADFAAARAADPSIPDTPEAFAVHKDRLYLDVAQRAVFYGWLLTVVTAASPVMDMSYVEKGAAGRDLFMGFATVRCSELGYWNIFAPTLRYDDVVSYARSIHRFVDEGLIRYPSELYYPVRLKPRGDNSLERLERYGVSHIELRMFDLNPLVSAGVDVRDVFFAQLMLVWLAGTPVQPFSLKDQVQAIQNFKNAARYDLQTVKIAVPDGTEFTVVDAANNVLGFMEEFFGAVDLPADVRESIEDCLAFQRAKFTDPENRYAWQLRREATDSYFETMMALAKARQDEALQ